MPTSSSEPVHIPIVVQGSNVIKPTTNEDESVIVGGLNLQVGDKGKISNVGTVPGAESDSSDSESEAEKVLRLLSEKREKLEAVKREKLRKVSEAKERDTVRHDMPSIREEPQSKSPSKSPEKSKSISSDNAEQKFATLPRGFKTKPSLKHPISSREDNFNKEVAGMKSTIKAVDQALSQVSKCFYLMNNKSLNYCIVYYISSLNRFLLT